MAEDGGDQPARKKARYVPLMVIYYCAANTDIRLSFASGTVQVLVGPNKESFDVHKDIICLRSPFFEAACSERWSKSGQSSAIELPEDDPEVFNTYLSNLYGCSGVLSEEIRGQEVKEGADHIKVIQLQLVAIYVLADKLGDVLSANQIIAELIGYCEPDCCGLMPRAAVKVAETTVHPSPLLNLAIDYYVHCANETQVGAVLDSKPVPDAFIGDVLREKTRLQMENKDDEVSDVFKDNFAHENWCRYHQHDAMSPYCSFFRCGK